MNPGSVGWLRWSVAFVQYVDAILSGNYLAELYWRNQLDKATS